MAETGRQEGAAPPVSDLKRNFKEHASSFRQVFEANRVKMDKLVTECLDHCHELESMKQLASAHRILEVISGVFAAMGLLRMFVLMDILSAMFLSPFAVLMWFRMKQQSKKKQCLASVEALMRDFKEILSLLHRRLEKVKLLCEGLREESLGCEQEKLMRLEKNILEFLLLKERLGKSVTPDSVNDVYWQLVKSFSSANNLSETITFLTKTEGPTEPVQQQ